MYRTQQSNLRLMFAITLFDYDRPVRPALRERLRTHKVMQSILNSRRMIGDCFFFLIISVVDILG